MKPHNALEIDFSSAAYNHGHAPENSAQTHQRDDSGICIKCGDESADALCYNCKLHFERLDKSYEILHPNKT